MVNLLTKDNYVKDLFDDKSDNSSKVDESEWNSVLADLNSVSGKSLEQLSKNNPDLIVYSCDPSVSQAKDNDSPILLTLKERVPIKQSKLKTGNLMGVVGFPNGTMLEIRSRFSEDNNFFLYYMLEKVFSINLLSFINNRKKGVLDLLPCMFPYYLKKAISKGLFKKYVVFNRNDSKLRGAVNVAMHLKQNMPFKGTICYTSRERTADNHVLQLIRHTIEYIKEGVFKGSLSSDSNIRNLVAQVVEATPTYKKNDRFKVIEKNLRPFSSPYFAEYKPLIRLCLSILRREKVSHGISKDHLYGLVFDGASLWEDYVNTLIQNDFYHPNNRYKSKKHHLFSDNESHPHKEGEIYPDFISKANDNRVIADAKYKLECNIGNRNADYFQILAYMYRFDSKTGIFLYPNNNPNNKDQNVCSTLFLNKGDVFENGKEEKRDDIKVLKYGIGIPCNCDKYEVFVSKMKQNEQTFQNDIKNYLTVTNDK